MVSAKAERGDAYLQATLETDPGARFLGELGIGTNFGIDRPIGAILFDEKIGGTVHLALGRSYPETGGTNESVVHWDLICDLREGGSRPPTASRCSSTGTSAHRPLPRDDQRRRAADRPQSSSGSSRSGRYGSLSGGWPSWIALLRSISAFSSAPSRMMMFVIQSQVRNTITPPRLP